MSSKCHNYPVKKLNEFLLQHSVITLNELDSFLSKNRTGNLNTRKSLLTYYRKKGQIIPVRRGIYATVPFGSNPTLYSVDPYLVASKLTSDAILGYHTALEYHGKAYSVFRRFYYISSSKSLPLNFQSHEFLRVPVQPSLRKQGKEFFCVNYQKRSGVEFRVTNLERTFVDVLDRSNLNGSLEEIWRSLESIEFFDLDKVIEYVHLLNNSTTTAKVGFFLEQHRESLMVEDKHLKPLRKLRPGQPHYFERSKRNNCQLVKNWNLLVPVTILNKTWEEVL